MKKLQKKSFQRSIGVIVALFTASNVLANEKIIQQEKLSFETCLQVISTSQNKLFLSPEINDVSDRKRIAIFTLSDGTLTIKCDGENGDLTVSTTKN